MNALLRWLTAPEWSAIVKALLHTLWQGALIAGLLSLVLRRSPRAATRYSLALASLAAVVGAGLFTWALLSRPLPREPHKPNASGGNAAFLSQPTEVQRAGEPGAVVATLQTTTAPVPTEPFRWTAWLALVWMAGAGLMLTRGAIQIAGAERLRRSSRPLEDSRVARLVDEARNALHIARQVRVAVTDRLTSPAVTGVLVPTLILPLSLLTTLTPDQIRFILLHELAHIRRADYLANLFQLFAEALLFFNPAVWWISHQVRREREACCDALAIELCDAPVDYAQTLVRVAETVLHPPPAAAPAFGDRGRNSSSLHDRVQRLLVPGYRPALRLTWRATLSGLLLGGTLLVLSAAGTRLTVAAILSPQQRIDQIEKKMAEYGQKPQPGPDFSSGDHGPSVEVSGRVRTADGSPVPKWVNVDLHTESSRYSRMTALSVSNGLFSNSVPQGSILISAEATNYAPVVVGPFDTIGSNQLSGIELVLQPGFDIRLLTVDANSGQPISAARVHSRFWPQRNGTSFEIRETVGAGDGTVVLRHCADMPLELTISAPGYEVVDKRLETLKPDQELRIAMRHGTPTFGSVRDRRTGAPIAGATVRMLYRKGPDGSNVGGPEDPRYLLATTDAQGQFNVQQLRQDSVYSIGVGAPGFENVVIDNILAGHTNLAVKLGPELAVRGHLTGDAQALQRALKDSYLSYSYPSDVAGQHSVHCPSTRLRIEGGTAWFAFTNPVAGPMTIRVAGQTFKRIVDAPVDDWQIELAPVPAAVSPTAMREVVFRFQHSSGVPPRGTVKVEVPSNTDPAHPVTNLRDIEIQNGEAHVEIPVGGQTSIEPDHVVGYWFKNDFEAILVTNGAGPMVIDVPLIPAGAIFASARNADGTPAGGLLFSVEELKRSPLLPDGAAWFSPGDSSSGNTPRKFVSGPLPLGGVYRIVGSRGNSFCVSAPMNLTDEKPDQEVELQFPADRPLDGQVLDPDGKPLRGVQLSGSFTAGSNFSHGLESVITDENGRFRIEDTTPQAGAYRLQIEHAPGWSAEFIDVNFSRLPLIIRVSPGLKLAGRVVESGTGYAIPDAEISVSDMKNKFPMQKTRTDADGRFEFTTLGNTSYQFFVAGAGIEKPARNSVKPGSAAPLEVEVRPWPGGRLKPRPPSATNAAAAVPATTAPPGSEQLVTREWPYNRPEFLRRAGLTNADPQLEDFKKAWLKFFSDLGVDMQPPRSMFAGGDLTQPRLMVRATPSELDRIKLAIQQLGPAPEFVPSTNPPAAQPPEPLRIPRVKVEQPPLETRLFAINPSAFFFNLERAGFHPDATNSGAGDTNAIKNFFASLGVDLSPPRALLYNGHGATLLVIASARDLGIVGSAVEKLNAEPPQINIQARFMEVPEKVAKKLRMKWPATQTASNGVRVVTLTPAEAREAARDIGEPVKDSLSVSQVTTAEHRQAQLQVVDLAYIITGINPAALTPPGVFAQPSETNGVFQVQPTPLGHVVDLIPSIAPDGRTIQLTVAPSATEFLGYDKPAEKVNVYVNGARTKTPTPLPRFRTRQTNIAASIPDGSTLMFEGFVPTETFKGKDGETHMKEVAPDPKRHLLFFVTPRIVNSIGSRVQFTPTLDRR
jgi:beta-lactamase regulating signal transducer with metallopeptidase domain/uncharacterized GH25 family protein